VDHEFAYADSQARLGGWITYVILDPTRPDPTGRFDFVVIYVGQTKAFGKRIRKRMRDAGTAVRRPVDQIDGALYDIMRRGAVPQFRVIDRVADAIASLVSETNWAKQLLSRGYPLLNKWTEQRFGGSAIDRRTIPHSWLWRLAVEDAIEARLEVIMTDKETGQELILDLRSWPSKTLLREVKASSIQRAQLNGRAVSVRLFVL
jgi:hypothetical protein